MRNFKTILVMVGALGIAACASESQQMDKQQPQAIEVAVKRAQFEMNCPAATGEVLSREVVQPALNGPLMMGVQRVEYTIGVAGCNQRNTYIVVCPEDGSGCFAAESR